MRGLLSVKYVKLYCIWAQYSFFKGKISNSTSIKSHLVLIQPVLNRRLVDSFGKPSKDVNILEASILASLPKSPTAYNPYSRRDRLMWYVYYHDSKNTNEGIVKVNKISDATTFSFFSNWIFKDNFYYSERFHKSSGIADFQWKSPFEKSIGTDCETVPKKDLMEFLNSLQLNATMKQEDSTTFPVVLEYQAGRKDRVLMRMYEDGYINDSEYKNALYTGLDFCIPRSERIYQVSTFCFLCKKTTSWVFMEKIFSKMRMENIYYFGSKNSRKRARTYWFMQKVHLKLRH